MSYYFLCYAGEATKKNKNSKPKNTGGQSQSKKNSKQDASSTNEQVVKEVVQKE
jgi:hypothetical protein